MILLANIQLDNRFTGDYRFFGDLYPKQILGKLIFPCQLVQRFILVFTIGLFGSPFGQENFTQRHQYDHSYKNTNQTDRQERKESKRFKTGIGQGILYDKVRRSTYQRHHTSHTAGKSQRHKQAT